MDADSLMVVATRESDNNLSCEIPNPRSDSISANSHLCSDWCIDVCGWHIGRPITNTIHTAMVTRTLHHVFGKRI